MTWIVISVIVWLLNALFSDNSTEKKEVKYFDKKKTFGHPPSLDEREFMSFQEFKNNWRKVPPSPGIYLIRNNENQLLYVGESQNIRSRLLDHIDSLEKNEHHSKVNKREARKMQTDFNLMGIDSFQFCVLEIMRFSSRRQREDKESFYINIFNCVVSGYNSLSHQRNAKKYKRKGLDNIIKDTHSEWDFNIEQIHNSNFTSEERKNAVEWVLKNSRSLKNLTEKQIGELEDLVFSNPEEFKGIPDHDKSKMWLKKFELLNEYYTSHKRVSTKIVYKDIGLGQWLKEQRKRQKAGTLDKEKERMLLSICSETLYPKNNKKAA